MIKTPRLPRLRAIEIYGFEDLIVPGDKTGEDSPSSFGHGETVRSGPYFHDHGILCEGPGREIGDVTRVENIAPNILSCFFNEKYSFCTINYETK